MYCLPYSMCFIHTCKMGIAFALCSRQTRTGRVVVLLYCSQKSFWYLGVWNELVAVCLVYPNVAARDTNDLQMTVS